MYSKACNLIALLTLLWKLRDNNKNSQISIAHFSLETQKEMAIYSCISFVYIVSCKDYFTAYVVLFLIEYLIFVLLYSESYWRFVYI